MIFELTCNGFQFITMIMLFGVQIVPSLLGESFLRLCPGYYQTISEYEEEISPNLFMMLE